MRREGGSAGGAEALARLGVDLPLADEGEARRRVEHAPLGRDAPVGQQIGREDVTAVRDAQPFGPRGEEPRVDELGEGRPAGPAASRRGGQGAARGGARGAAVGEKVEVVLIL